MPPGRSSRPGPAGALLDFRAPCGGLRAPPMPPGRSSRPGPAGALLDTHAACGGFRAPLMPPGRSSRPGPAGALLDTRAGCLQGTQRRGYGAEGCRRSQVQGQRLCQQAWPSQNGPDRAPGPRSPIAVDGASEGGGDTVGGAVGHAADGDGLAAERLRPLDNGGGLHVHGYGRGVAPESRLRLRRLHDAIDAQERTGMREPRSSRQHAAGAARHQHDVGDDEIAGAEMGGERATGAGGNHERGGPTEIREAFEVKRARAGADNVDGPPAVAKLVVTAPPDQTQMASEAMSFDVDGGDDEEAAHASVTDRSSGPGSAAPEPASLRFSQAA